MLSGVNTDKEPTFNTPLEPTTMPFGETNTTCPLVKPPFLLIEFTIPLILIWLSIKLINVEISLPLTSSWNIKFAISPLLKSKS